MNDPIPLSQAANACRFWPTGRGIFHNDDKTFLVWVNEEDHLRIISMQKGGDLGQVYRRMVAAVKEIEKRLPFSHHNRLGFLTFCPTNLGTTIRASVHIKLPKLASDKKKLEEVAGKYNLQVRTFSFYTKRGQIWLSPSISRGVMLSPNQGW
jgi:creatine kinase